MRTPGVAAAVLLGLTAAAKLPTGFRSSLASCTCPHRLLLMMRNWHGSTTRIRQTAHQRQSTGRWLAHATEHA